MEQKKLISIVIPVFNEDKGLEVLYRRLESAISQSAYDFEIIFVNDGSGDDSLEVLIALHEKDRRIKIVDLSRNFWHQNALTAGIDHTKGEAVIFMDADLEDRPECIALFIDYKTITKIIRKTQVIGISIRGYFMLGFVGEMEAEMQETIRFATFLNPDIATFSLLIPFPGTPDYIRAQKEGGGFDPLFFRKKIVPEFNFLDDPIYYAKDISPKRLLEIHREAYRRFY